MAVEHISANAALKVAEGTNSLTFWSTESQLIQILIMSSPKTYGFSEKFFNVIFEDINFLVHPLRVGVGISSPVSSLMWATSTQRMSSELPL